MVAAAIDDAIEIHEKTNVEISLLQNKKIWFIKIRILKSSVDPF